MPTDGNVYSLSQIPLRGCARQINEVGLKDDLKTLIRDTVKTAIIERYRRRESSVEESLIEMYLAGVSVRRVEDVTELLWGSRVSASTVSNLNQMVYGKIEERRKAQAKARNAGAASS